MAEERMRYAVSEIRGKLQKKRRKKEEERVNKRRQNAKASRKVKR